MTEPALPQVGESVLYRHFIRLSHRNFSLGTNFYPLGSCTMKYNPPVNEKIAKLPGLSALRAWTGHRPATPDKLPLIGPTGGNERIWLATGHEGLGITTSLGTGQLLADLILKRTTAIPAAPYSPARLERLEANHG